MRILWASNYPDVHTGYGTQTAQVVKRLVADGHEVAVSANYGLAGREDNWNGVHVFPASYDAWGNDVLPADLAEWSKGGPTWMVTLFDTWVYARDRFQGLNVASWVPIDHYPAPPGVVDWCREHAPIAMSRYGQEQLKLQGIDASYVPHALEKVFHPRDRDAIRAERGWSDRFVVFINAANKGNNPIRKSWSEMFGALSAFIRQHDDVLVYINSEVNGFQSPDLGLLATIWGLTPDRVQFVDQYAYKRHRISDDTLAEIYSASDVLLSTSMGEGFGIAVIEAQACGTPVIVTDFSAQPELVGAGWKVPYQLWYDPGQHSFLAIPGIPAIVERLEEAYRLRGNTELRRQAVEFAAQYDADTVFDTYWRPILAEMEAALEPPKVSRAKRRKNRRKAA